MKALASRSDVVKVSRIVPKTATNANTANLVRALQTWKSPGSTGKGVKIAVIDTGLDYTHADFGGKGTVAAYDSALADTTPPAAGARPCPQLGKDKIIGGYDLAGDDYDADPGADTYQPIPHPDPNPLDCNEHGTHVAGTAAGYGVNEERHDVHREVLQARRRQADEHEDRPRHGSAGPDLLAARLRLRRIDRPGDGGAGPRHGPEPGRQHQGPLRHDQPVGGL